MAFEDYACQVNPPSKLAVQLDANKVEKHLIEIARDLVDLDELVPSLGLTHQQFKDIKEENRGSVKGQKCALLRLWRQINGKRATYRELLTILVKCRETDAAEALVKCLQDSAKKQDNGDQEKIGGAGDVKADKVDVKQGGVGVLGQLVVQSGATINFGTTPPDKDEKKSMRISIESLQKSLQQQLEFLMSLPCNTSSAEAAKLTMMKAAIDDFIAKGVKVKANYYELKFCLGKLYEADLLLSREAHEYALKEASVVTKARVDVQVIKPSDHQEAPLFCEDTVYHASLCCYAVNTRNRLNYMEFFSNHRHQFEEISFSRDDDHSNVERYVIARKGKTYFIAFLSEPDFLQWPKRFINKTFSDGIEIQSKRIPLRFFIQQLHNNCQVVCTGFSFGGLLAQSMAASIWKQESASILEKNLCCICLSPLCIDLPVLRKVSNETPEIKSTLHSIVLEDDFIPPITNFLNPEITSKFTVYFEELQKLSPEKGIEGSIAFNLPNQIGILQNAFKLEGQNSDEKNIAEAVLRVMKDLLKESWEVFVEKGNTLLGNIYLIETTSLGLLWNPVTDKRLKELAIMKNFKIDSLTIESLFQNDASCYHGKILKSFIKTYPAKSNSSFPEFEILKPEIESVSFHRHGKELVITVTGNNLWFSNEVKVCSLSQLIPPEGSSQKSLQFNHSEDYVRNYVDTTSDYVEVKIYSHFSDVIEDRVQVERKVYEFSHRQEQLAMLTPSELIKTGYLSALLEQSPQTDSTDAVWFSHRFETIRQFLENVIHVVPIESLVHAVSVADDLDIAVKCCRQLMHLDKTLSVSHTMHASLQNAVKRMTRDSEKLSSSKESEKVSKNYTLFPQVGVVHGVSRFSRSVFKGTKSSDCSSGQSELTFLRTMSRNGAGNEAICGLDLSCVYPADESPDNTDSAPRLNSPLQILREGRKKIQNFMKSSARDFVAPQKKLQESINDKMLELVNEIYSTEVELCSLLLGAFMEEQTSVPMTKTSHGAKRIIDVAVSMAAIGIWALFSLTVGNVEGLIESNPSQSVWVQVKDYIKSYFTEKTETADENYAGKLQFLVQSMKETVSYNSRYVSYSLERQLIEICRKLKIKVDVPIKTLLNDWDELFEGTVMSLVSPSYRSLIARWLKWSLMVHHLREELARYSAVGVIGLVNSGKSLLVSKLFNIQISVGTKAENRTTVPLLYNLDGKVDGLDVIDFPGVDDRDESIPKLAELLLAIAQVVIFVVDYRKAHTEPAKKWLQLLQKVKSVPLLVCLTHADKLYAEYMDKDGAHPEASEVKAKIQSEKENLKLGSFTVHYFSICQDKDSTLNNNEGRERLKAAGIETSSQKVGDWLADTFERHLDQEDLARKLRAYVHRPKIW